VRSSRTVVPLKKSRSDAKRRRILMVAHEHQPVSVGEVAEQTIMEPSTAMRAMQRLESDALITIVTRRSDQRVSEAQLTRKGYATTERVLKAASRVYRLAFASLDAPQVETLIGLLAEVHRALRNPI